MALQPIASTVELTTARSVDDAREAIAGALVAIKGERRDAGSWLQFRLGSATWVRIWGLWTPNAYKHLPLLADVSVTDLRTERLVRIEFRSDEGPYLVRLGRVAPAYQRRFNEITTAVEHALIRSSP
ncbi:MAG TPA: hypothetical protein VL294_03800 [Pseudolysinimonas sp.]|nr:hypothetical protein [Pseudolysinimonas sp.]